MLASPTGGQLFLFDVLTDAQSDYLSADAYIAERGYRSGTVFTIAEGGRPLKIQTRDDLHEGLHLHPGDPKHFGQLAEPALFLLVEETTDGS